MASENQENGMIKGMWKKVASRIVEGAKNVKKLGQEDPRKIIHSVKVGLAIAVVSLLYYFDPIYDGFGVSATWAVMTVVVVFEFSVGATLGKGINRAVATLLGCALGVAVHRLASLSGNEIIEPIVLGTSVFLFAAGVTFMRFLPKLKARYDYGMLIFNLTFCLICVSSYRDDEVLDMALKRLLTIFIGGTATVLICVIICPFWAGADLHNLVTDNIEKLGTFLEGFGDEYFKKLPGDRNLDDIKDKLQGYKSIVNAKNTEDSLANFARWEPRHGGFRYRHPWGHYQKVAALTRECAYRLDSLNGYLKAEMQMHEEIQAKFEECCTKMSKESSKALKKMAVSMKAMTSSSAADSHILNAKNAAEDLKEMLKTNPWQGDLLEVIPVATVASLLAEVVSFTSKIADSVQELASLAKFKASEEASNVEQIVTDERFMRTPSIASHNLSVSTE